MSAAPSKTIAVKRPSRVWLLGSDPLHAAQLEAGAMPEGWQMELRLHSLQHLLLHLHCEVTAPDVLVCGLRFDDGDAFRLMRLLANDPRAPALLFVLQAPQRVVRKSVLAMAQACGLRVAGCVEQPQHPEQLFQLLQAYRQALPERAPAAPQELTAAEVRTMLQAGRLYAWVQPQVQLDSREVVGVEAMVRGVDEDGTPLPQEQIMAALRRHDLLDTATLQHARQLCDFLAECQQDGLTLQGSLGVSIHSLSNPDFCAELQRLVRQAQLDPARITLQISESDAAGDLATVTENSARCRLMGFNLCVADFGTAHSSLVQLSQLPLTALKFARALVAHLEADATRRTIVASCAGLARGLGLRVGADGVDSTPELRALQAAGCTEVQGALLGRPMSMEAMRQWLLGLNGRRVPLGKRRSADGL